MKVTISMLVVFLSVSVMVSAQRRMTFGENGSFKIVQFTDTHMDMKIDTMHNVLHLIKDVVAAEKPNLVVFTGDVVIQKNPASVWQKLMSQMDSLSVPWTLTFGNHDWETGMENHEIYGLIRDSRMLVMDAGPMEVAGTGNFVIELIENDGKHPANILYLFDTHSYARKQLPEMQGYAWIEDSQIKWYCEMAERYGVPALAFLHIPLPEYKEVPDDKTRIIGEWNEDICSPKLNTGMFAAMKQCGDVQGIFVGHDHDNSYIANHLGIALAYGRFSGVNDTTYGKLEPGARIIIINAGKKSFETYIRLRSGEIIDRCIFPESFNHES